MNGWALVLLALFALGGGAAIVGFLRLFQRLENQMNKQTQTLQTEMLEMSRQMNRQLSGNANIVHDYTRLMGEFQNRLGQLQESTQSMIRIGEDISSLQDILKTPK
jgi:hypothetical protein